MADVWYLIVRTPPSAVDIWPIGEDACSIDPTIVARTAAYVAAAEVAVGCPADWNFLPGYDVSMGPGIPAESLLAVATVHDAPPLI